MSLVKNFFLDKKLIVYQPEKGFRFAIDAPLIADFIQTREKNTLLEIGGGCGIISLILFYTKKFKSICILEIQRKMIKAIRKNIIENRFFEKIHVVHGDFNNPPFKKKFNIIYSNPPYLKLNNGKMSKDESKAISKFEILLNAEQLIKNSYELILDSGSLYLIYPFYRKSEVYKLSKKYGFFLHRERIIYPRKGRKAVFFIAELKKIKSEKVIRDSLVLEGENGKYRDEIEKILRGKNVYH